MSALLGRLTKHVALFAPAATADGRGGQAPAADVPLRPARAWMSIIAQSASEVLGPAGQRKPVRRFVGRMRYHAQVREGVRVSWQGRTFEVIGVTNRDEANRELTLELIERTRVTGGTA